MKSPSVHDIFVLLLTRLTNRNTFTCRGDKRVKLELYKNVSRVICWVCYCTTPYGDEILVIFWGQDKVMFPRAERV